LTSSANILHPQSTQFNSRFDHEFTRRDALETGQANEFRTRNRVPHGIDSPQKHRSRHAFVARQQQHQTFFSSTSELAHKNPENPTTRPQTRQVK
jgi:hypothetical protein